MGLFAKFAVIFAVLGLLVSVAFGILGGNRFSPLVVTAIICSILAGASGVGAYKVLESRVPEVFELFAPPQSVGSSDDDLSLSDGDADADASDGMLIGDDVDAPTHAAAEDAGKRFGDHLIVDKIKIKNEPKLMAEAIKTMLAKDKS